MNVVLFMVSITRRLVLLIISSMQIYEYDFPISSMQIYEYDFPISSIAKEIGALVFNNSESEK
jgi:hypothetical protein